MSTHAPRFIELVNNVKSRIQETTVTEIQERRLAGEQFHLVDVREESEWMRGRIPDSIHLSKGVIERDIEKTIPSTEEEVVLYCGGGFRSALAADILQQMGYSNVKSMDGGISGWVEAGFPVDTE